MSYIADQLRILDIEGTECCGLYLVSNFDPYMVDKVLQELDIIGDHPTDEDEDGYDVYLAYYCVIAGTQIPKYEEELLKRGWVKGMKWVNQNSDNLCIMFTLTPRG